MSALVMSLVLASISAGLLAPSSAAATPAHPIRLEVLSAPHEVTAPGVLRFQVRLVNLTSRTQRHLWVASNGVLDGQPGWGGVKPVLDRRCKAGGGTGYCPLPPLGPHEVLTLEGAVKVPLHILGHRPTTIGKHATASVQIIRRPSGAAVSRSVGVDARIRASDQLAFTGAPARTLMIAALTMLAFGVGLARTRPHRNPRQSPIGKFGSA